MFIETAPPPPPFAALHFYVCIYMITVEPRSLGALLLAPFGLAFYYTLPTEQRQVVVTMWRPSHEG